MKNKLIEYEGRKIAIDRSVGVSIIVISNNRLLCNKRGKYPAGLWNIPSGYLDWDETAEECARRETFEECGIEIPLENIKLLEVSTNPKENKQNVIFRFIACVPEDFLQLPLSTEHSEEGEVLDIKWIPLADIDNYQFAWGQAETVKRLLTSKTLIYEKFIKK